MAMSGIVEKEDGASLRAWLLVMGKTSKLEPMEGLKKHWRNLNMIQQRRERLYSRRFLLFVFLAGIFFFFFF